jgi:acyl carrier protein
MDITVEILRQIMIEAGIESRLVLGLRPDVPLLKQGIDSLDYPAFVVAMESRFGLAIDDAAMLSLRTLDDFIGYIRERTA